MALFTRPGFSVTVSEPDERADVRMEVSVCLPRKIRKIKKK